MNNAMKDEPTELELIDQNNRELEEQAQRDYEQSVQYAEYCERFEPTYNPEDGSM